MLKKKIIFMGTPSFSIPILEMLIENYNVIAVVTQPDKEVGRKKEMVFSDVKEVALNSNIKIFQPLKIRNEYKDIIKLKPDIIVTCAYGQILPKEILNAPKYGCINVHASLLPKLRGGAPIHRALIDGYEETGITIMEMDEQMDTGDIITQKSIKILDTDNVGTLHNKLSHLGATLLNKTLPLIFEKKIKKIKQKKKDATYANLIKREDELIDFNQKAKDVFNKIRGLDPFPGAYAVFDDLIVKLFDVKLGNNKGKKVGEIIEIYDDGIGIATKDGEVIIKTIQFSGKRKMFVRNYLNGITKDQLLGKVFNK